MNEGLDFDDILILPRPSRVISRSDVDLSVNLVNLKLKIPVIAAPMKGIVSPDLIIELSRLGGIGMLHRFYENYDGWLCDVYRIGIGSGTLCITRNMTGIGCPQITAIKNCLITKQAYIVADGGIRNSGDAVKALAAGADIVMLGTLLAQTYESSHNGIIY